MGKNNDQLPKMMTRSEYLSKLSEEEKKFELGFALFGARSQFTKLPAYDDAYDIERKAEDDYKNRNFGEMMEYVESLVSLVNHWEDYAKELHRFLLKEGYIFDEESYPTGEKILFKN